MPKSGHNGSRWITPARRLAVYRRDGFTCAYCAKDMIKEDRNLVTLDHVIPGNGNDCNNLITACKACNASKGNRPYFEFIMGANPPDRANRIIFYIHHALTRTVTRRDIRVAGSDIKRGVSEWHAPEETADADDCTD